MKRLENYCALLEHIYGTSVVELFTAKNAKDRKLTMKNESDNLLSKKKYRRKKGEGCVTCQSIYRTPDFLRRILEFPGWIGDLNFTETSPAKEIMIIGEAPTILKDHINIAFGLGLYPIEKDGNLNTDRLKQIYSGEEAQLKVILKQQIRKNKLWEYLNLLFLNKLSVIKPIIYVTDLCKCNDDIMLEDKTDKNQAMWKNCLSECLLDEIKLINPKLIIFQSWSPYNYLKEYLIEKKIINSEEEILEDVECYFSNNKDQDYSNTKLYYNPFFGKFPFNGNNIYFFVILHQSYFYRRLNKNKRTNYINRNHHFIEEKILKEVLQIKEKKKKI